MSKFSVLLSAAFIAAGAITFSSGSVWAQSETEEEAEPAGNDLAVGEVVDETPKPGDTYVKETFNDWAIRCIVVANADDRCQLYQLLADRDESPIAEFTLFRLPEGGQAAAGATIIVPLETSLSEQLTIKVDDQPAKRYPFAFCNPVGCYARIGLTADDVEAYKKGSEATLSIVPIAAPDQRVNVTMSLSGFTAGFAAASEINQ